MAEQKKDQELSPEMLEKVSGGYYNMDALRREIRQKRASGMSLDDYLKYVHGGIGSMNEYEWREMADYIIACWEE